jgi:hypothetical protein
MRGWNITCRARFTKSNKKKGKTDMTKFHPTDTELLQKGLAAQMSRIPGGTGSPLVKTKIKVNHIPLDDGTIVNVEHLVAEHGMSVAGVTIDLDEVPLDARDAFIDAASALDSSANAAVVATARRVIRDVVRDVVRRKPGVGRLVRQRSRKTA